MGGTRRWFVLCFVAALFVSCASSTKLFFQTHRPDNMDDEGHYVFNIVDPPAQKILNKIFEKEAKTPSFIPADQNLEDSDFESIKNFFDPNEDTEKDLGELSRRKRQAPSTTAIPVLKSPLSQNVTRWVMNDTLRQMIVHWAGKGSPAIVVLTKDVGVEEVATQSNVYFSPDYGQTFQRNTVIKGTISKFVHTPTDINSYIFVDIKAKTLYTTRDMGQHFATTKCPFEPTFLSTHPVHTTHVIGYDKKASKKVLYVSKDYGHTWLKIQEDIKAAHWGYSSANDFDNPNTLYVERLEPSGRVSILKTETYFQDDDSENVLVSNVEDFAIRNNSLFATRPGQNGDNDLLLTVSRSPPFVVANIPTKVAKKEFFIIDAADQQIMILVSHGFGRTDLYISEQNKVDYTFSLANVTYFNPDGIGSSQTALVNRDDRFADIHKVKGLRTIFLANTASTLKSGQYNMTSMKSQITFDKGVIWEDVPPPRTDSTGAPMCNTSRCSLHIMQEFHHAHITTMSSLIMSEASAPGYILASGNVGDRIKNHIDLFFSPNGGKDWREIRKGEWFYTWADHGGIIGIVKKYGKTKDLLYTLNEGQTWHNITFYNEPINVYGLMTEPGETTTIFTVFGATNEAKNSWVIVQVDLMAKFTRQCNRWQYREWSPEDENGVSCLLGAKYVYSRKSMYNTESCYNGKDYDRPTSIRSCPCTRFDFECDRGFYLLPNSHSLACKLDSNSNVDPYEIPPNCRSGTTYKRTKGYRRIPADICKGGDADKAYGPTDTQCPVIEEDAFLLITSSTGISRIDLETDKLENLPVNVGYASGIHSIDFDYKTNCIYYTQNSNIERICLDGSSTANKTIVHELQQISAMAFDWDSRNMYWATQSTPPTIKVMNLDSTQRYVRKLAINSSLLHQATSIAVYSRKGYFYYSDLGSYYSGSKIIRAKMDGTNATVLTHDYSSRWYSSLQIDEGSNRLFFISKSSYFSKVGSMDLDGDHFQQAVTYDSQARYVTTFKEYAYYWREPGDIQRADKYGYTSNYTVAFNIINMGAMKAIRRGLQAYPNKCGNNTSKCPQLCIPMPVEGQNKDAGDKCYCDNVNYVTSGKTCGCRPGEILTGNGQCEPNKTSCNSKEFRCRNGRCIPLSWKCDRGNDCSDGSDEESCAYASCKPNHHHCGNSDYCISNDWVCDGETDCADGSDEANCKPKTCNATSQFTCKSGQCINKMFKCDGNYDCSDLSDEENCFTTPSTCTGDQMLCETALFGSRCIPSNWKCDGENDCTDGSDERGCNVTITNCSSYQFDCGNGVCILKYWQCDGENDCGNGADEKNCSATTVQPATTTTLPFHHGTCGLTEMICQNHAVCIPLEWKCDGTNDCGDHSDEFGCTTSTNHSLIGPHHCFSSSLQYKCDNGLCILSFFECDGDNDCGDWSDEEHCPGFYEHGNHPGCFTNNGFDYTGSRNYTKSGRICQKWSRNTPHRPHYWPQNRDHNFCRNPDNDGYGPWCYTTDPDKRWEYCGIPHCANNGSSPVYPVPTREPNSCHDGYYSCGDDKCIPDRWVCDGDFDCDNHADEDWCNFTCNAAAEIMCHNKRCVPKSSKCDGVNDCLDNTDEENCASPTTPTCNPSTDFTCMDDNHCIPISSHCNGIFDCRDHSDEYNCTSGGGTTASPSWTITCPKSYKYIGPKDLCNYVPDCPEATDESWCSKHVIPGISSKKCTDDDNGACETIQWSVPKAPIPQQYASVMKYMIYYGSQVDSEQFDDIKKLNARHAKITESSVKLTGLEWNTQYFVYITMSFNGTILPLQQDSRSRFDTGLGKPGVPTNVEVRQDRKIGENTYASIVTWNAPTKNQRGIKFYYVKSTYKDNSQSDVARVSYYEMCTHCTHTLYLRTGIVNVSVLASNIGYNSSWSKPFTLSVAKLQKPVLKLGVTRGYSYDISWTIPTDQAPSDFAGFRVRIASNDLGARYMNILDSSARKTTVTKLQPQTPYRLSVSYLNNAGIAGLYSEDHEITITNSSLQPIFPKIVKTSSNSTTSITVTLAPAPKSKDVMYEVSWNVRLERDISKVKKVNGTSVIITNLPVNIQQILQVRVIEPYIGKYSEETHAKPQYDFSEAPRNVYVKVNKDHVTGYINFDRPTDSYSESLAYLLSISETDTKNVLLTHPFKNTMNATMHYEFGNLVPGTTYTASVRVNAKGAMASNHTFVDGVVEGPTILNVKEIGHGTNRYQVLVHVKDEFKSFYKSSSVTGIQSYKCEGVDVVCATNNAQCTALKDQPANVEEFEVSGMEQGHNYTLCVRAHCRAEHECAFYSYSVPLGANGGIFSPVTAAPSFTLTPVHIAAVVAPVLALVLILVGVIAYLQIRKKRLADAYRGFVASHYDPQSGEAIFVSNNDDDDNGFALDDENDAETPLITGFADDEPLIVA